MKHLIEIGEESNTDHIVCGDFNLDIAGGSDRKQNLSQNWIYMPCDLSLRTTLKILRECLNQANLQLT